MEKANDFCIVFVTTSSYDDSSHIMKILISERLAACCTVIQNCVSMFGWDNAIQERHEYLMMIKTTKARLDAMEKRIIELHKDEVPEIIVTDITSGHAPYLNWVKESTSITN